MPHHANSAIFSSSNQPPRRPGGRPKGSKTFSTQRLREYILKLLMDDMQGVALDLKRLRKQSLYKYFKVRNEMMAYALPRLAAVAIADQQLKPPIILMGGYSEAEMAKAEAALETNQDQDPDAECWAGAPGAPNGAPAPPARRAFVQEGRDDFTEDDEATANGAPALPLPAAAAAPAERAALMEPRLNATQPMTAEPPTAVQPNPLELLAPLVPTTDPAAHPLFPHMLDARREFEANKAAHKAALRRVLEVAQERERAELIARARHAEEQ